MTAAELIERLSELPPDAVVFGWQDGERFEIESVDYFDEESRSADINLSRERLPENAS
jgi:hypothetical protein